MENNIISQKKSHAAWLLLIPALIFAALLYLVLRNDTQNYDETFLLLVHDFTPKESAPIWHFLTEVFDPKYVIVMGVAVALACLLAKKWRNGLVALGGVGVAALANIILKHAFERPRPELWDRAAETGFSFPSGHAMMIAALATVLVIICRKWSWRGLVSTVGLFLIIAVCYSRLFFGVHYLTDVAAGVAAGIFVAGMVGSIVLSDWWMRLWAAVLPVVPSRHSKVDTPSEKIDPTDRAEVGEINAIATELTAPKNRFSPAPETTQKRPLGNTSRKKIQ